MKFIFVLTALFFAFSPLSHAEDQSSGCGLGWKLFTKNSLLSSTSRSITNAVASNTIAMTLGTSGCAKHDIVMKYKEALYFAEGNYQKLQTEFAEGKGEHLEALARILGCNHHASKNAGAVFQSRYEIIFPSDTVTPAKMLDQTAGAIFQSDLASQCMNGA